MKRIGFSILFALLLVVIQGNSQHSKPLNSNQIDSLVARTMATMPLAGIAVAVVKDGKLVHAEDGVTAVSANEK
jgi:CubicO group peptidase (beta-lactamase class C family)